VIHSRSEIHCHGEIHCHIEFQRGEASVRITYLAAVAAIALIGVCAAAPAAAQDVDRARLQKAALLPSVAPGGWYYVAESDGRIYEGGQETGKASVAVLEARLAAADSDPRSWLDLAEACRRTRNPVRERACLTRAVAILREVAEERSDDGAALAALGLALATSGDEAGAAKAIQSAERAARNRWAGAAASADLLVTRAIAAAAQQPFRTLREATTWWSANPERASRVQRALLDAALVRYDAAVAGVESAEATGPDAASVYMRRSRLLGALLFVESQGADRAAVAELAERTTADSRKALELLRSEPYAVTLIALRDAMPKATEPGGARRVASIGGLSDAARAKLTANLDALRLLAGADDPQLAARALQGLACVQWYVYQDPGGTEALLRKSIAKYTGLDQTWIALVSILARAGRYDDLATLSREWLKTGDSADKRLLLAKARHSAGHVAGAETEWRAAHALAPRDFKTNLGVAVLTLQRAETEADVTEARTFLDTAAAALLGSDNPPPHRFIIWGLADAVAAGLAGDVDGAANAARRVLGYSSEVAEANEILSALGR